MSLTKEQKETLREPINPKRVKQRKGGAGRSLPYIETWDAKAHANWIFGFGEWGTEIVGLVDLGIEQTRRERQDGTIQEGHRVAYRCHIRLTVDGCKPIEDVGYGEDVNYSSILQGHELAIKEAVSDALKRCLVAFGDQFGLSLYDKDYKAAAPRSTSSPSRARAGSRTKPRASHIALLSTCKDVGVDDTLRHRITLMLTRGRTQSVKELDDEQADQITQQIKWFGANKPKGLRELEAWEAKQT